MAYYYTCPECGANLDPGEECDCETIQSRKRLRKRQSEACRLAEQEDKNER